MKYDKTGYTVALSAQGSMSVFGHASLAGLALCYPVLGAAFGDC